MHECERGSGRDGWKVDGSERESGRVERRDGVVTVHLFSLTHLRIRHADHRRRRATLQEVGEAGGRQGGLAGGGGPARRGIGVVHF